MSGTALARERGRQHTALSLAREWSRDESSLGQAKTTDGCPRGMGRFRPTSADGDTPAQRAALETGLECTPRLGESSLREEGNSQRELRVVLSSSQIGQRWMAPAWRPDSLAAKAATMGLLRLSTAKKQTRRKRSKVALGHAWT